jgi:hypothetical protein
LQGARAVLRYASGLGRFLRSPLDPAAARALIDAQLAAREAAFLTTLERGVYGHAASPYRKLLQHAKLDLGDVRRLVRDTGLEGTLERLYDAGVYVTPEEFKGRRPIRRGGLEIPVRGSDFDNLLLGSHYHAQSSGSRGVPSRAFINFDVITHEAAHLACQLEWLGLSDRPVAIWRAALLDGLKTSFRYAKAGRSLERWFTQGRFTWNAEGLRRAYLLNVALLATRLLGRPLPRPDFAPRADVLNVARWLAEKARAGRPAVLETNPSPCVRVCLAARESGLDIGGTFFHIVGEPYTPAKAEVVAAVGARAMSRYAMRELGIVGLGCARPVDVDEIHLLSDKVALIQRAKTVAASGAAVGALVFTTLLPSCPKLMLNTEMDDYATLRERDCGCWLEEMGFHTHLSGIRSYEKLTSEGVAFLGSELFKLLEEVLPARLGGGPTDYQLVEEEEQDGLPRVSLVVRPSVGKVDERTALAAVFEALEGLGGGGRLMADEWRQGGTLRVVRRDPYETGSAKILPLHVLQSTPARGARPEQVVSQPMAKYL